MNKLVFEVWRDEGAESQQAGVVHPQNDKVRVSTMPRAVLVHTLTAYSDRDFWRQFYAWDGKVEWEPDESLPEHFFTEQELKEQQDYLKRRSGS
ncbi:hypothetical protein [Sphingomonas koreensis]